MPSLCDSPIETLTEADLQRLITDEIPENRQLEYKRDLWCDSGDGQREFLKDLAAFANAQGGDLIVGIEERDHLPVALTGVAVADPEGLSLALENRHRSRLEPPLNHVPMHWITLANGRQVLVIRVSSSLRAPHRDRQSGHFPIRGERRIDYMGIDELRDTLLGSEQLSERLRQMHRATANIHGRPELPDEVTKNAGAVVSVMPLDVLRARRDLPITAAESVLAYLFGQGGWTSTVTLEGTVSTTGGDQITSFAVTHRQGRIDAFWTIKSETSLTDVAPYRFEEGLVSMVTAAQARLRQYGVGGELIVMTTLVGLFGTTLRPSFPALETDPPLRRTIAELPDVVGTRIGSEELQPVLKAFWRLYGRTQPSA